MPITFASIDDPYGIRSAGGALGQALMQSNMEQQRQQNQLGLLDKQNQFAVDKDARLKEQAKTQSGALSTALTGLSENGDYTPQQIGFLQNFLQGGGAVDDGLQLMKLFTEERLSKAKPIPKGDFEKSQIKDISSYVTEARQQGAQADQMLKDLPQLRKAILSPELADQSFINRYLTAQAQKLPGGSSVLNEQEQIISTFGKNLITDFTGMKGFRLTDSKLRWLENAAPAVGKTPESNERALQIFEDMYKVRSAIPLIIDDIISKNGGEPPLDLQTQVSKRLSDAISQYIEEQPDWDGKEREQEVGEGFEQLPSASEYKGSEVKDNETGTIYRSDGKHWTKV